MEEKIDDRYRETWTTRVAVRPKDRDALRDRAKQEMVSVAYLIGIAITDLVTPRSS